MTCPAPFAGRKGRERAKRCERAMIAEARNPSSPPTQPANRTVIPAKAGIQRGVAWQVPLKKRRIWRNGRRACLKSTRLRPCSFESRLPHQSTPLLERDSRKPTRMRVAFIVSQSANLLLDRVVRIPRPSNCIRALGVQRRTRNRPYVAPTNDSQTSSNKEKSHRFEGRFWSIPRAHAICVAWFQALNHMLVLRNQHDYFRLIDA